jgi:hypothetical protein
MAGAYQFLRALSCPPSGAPDARVAHGAWSFTHVAVRSLPYFAGAFASDAADGGRSRGLTGGARPQARDACVARGAGRDRRFYARCRAGAHRAR